MFQCLRISTGKRRRRSACKAAVAAAAHRKWKVGDLVLAKVKGYPPWPATVSEPKKWGYSADWKKVLVYFFGTQQIAFCNPSDVEAFTEEKKQSLLIKLQGKGSDFVRAVREIVDSYEKLKKETEIDSVNSGGGVAGVNSRNSMELPVKLGLKELEEVNKGTLDSRTSPAHFDSDRTEMKSANDMSEDAEIAKEESMVEKVSCDTAAMELSSPITSQRKTTDSGSLAAQQNAPIIMSTSSSRVENSAIDVGFGNTSTGVSRDVYQRRKLMKSPDTSRCEDADLALCSNDSVEDNISDIMTVDSDAVSLNECSTIDFDGKAECTETTECFKGDAQKLDLQVKAAVIKKRRKPNRKRMGSDTAKLSMTLDNEVGVEASIQNNIQSYQKIEELCSKEDGDKHLPLSKRARVRMGKSSFDNEIDCLSYDKDRRLREDSTNQSRHIFTSSHRDDHCPNDKDSLVCNTAMEISSPAKGSVMNAVMDKASLSVAVLNASEDNSSPSEGSTSRDSGFLHNELRKYEMCSRTMDVEAALPPSKRLHRALKAMSANTVDEVQVGNNLSSTKILSSDCCTTCSKCPCMHTDKIVAISLDPKEINSACNSSHVDRVKIAVKYSGEAGLCCQLAQNSVFQNQLACSNVLPDDQPGGKNLSTSASSVASDTQIPKMGDASPKPDGMQNEVGFLQDPSGISLVPSDKGASDTTQSTENGIQGLSGSIGKNKASPHASYCASHETRGLTSCETGECLKPPVNSNDNVDRSVVVKDVRCDVSVVCEKSVSHPCLGERSPVGIVSSLCLVDAGCGGGVVHGSSLNASGCNISTSESSYILPSNGSSSPDVHLNSKKAVCGPVFQVTKLDVEKSQRLKSTVKSEEAGHTALVSFEAALVRLTRTKESIGRATRIAIDCAKFGVASKVVEVLARSLETESSLHRRVDLFFLVDSITQCSRGLKGDGGVYPSAIQSALSRLLSAAAPVGTTTQENRRQCLKVLRLWLQRRILPEPIVRQHMRELDCNGCSTSVGAYSRRSMRTERPMDDPVREMEGMLVDEYGSNSSFQLPGFCMPRMLKDDDEGSDSDGGSFEAVTPERDPTIQVGMSPTIERHRHILEDVDGELEMEDAAPSCGVGMSSLDNCDRGNATQASHSQIDKDVAADFVPPLPCLPQSYLPLASSPSPSPSQPPCPPSKSCLSVSPDAYATDAKEYLGTTNTSVRSVSQQLDNAHYRSPEFREPPLQRPESSSAYSSFHVPPRDQHSDTAHDKPYPLRPPHHIPSDQFSFVHGHHSKSRREAPQNHSHRYHYERHSERDNYYSNHDRGSYYNNHDRENYYSHRDRENYYYNHERENYYSNHERGNYYTNNHERIRPPRYEFRDNWRLPAPYSGPRHYNKGVSTPYGCHPCEPSRLPGHGWKLPPRSMNHRNPFPHRGHFESAIPVASRGNGFWRPR